MQAEPPRHPWHEVGGPSQKPLIPRKISLLESKGLVAGESLFRAHNERPCHQHFYAVAAFHPVPSLEVHKTVALVPNDVPDRNTNEHCRLSDARKKSAVSARQTE